MLRYRLIPVPAGISLPMITFSFKPSSLSLLPWIAASVRILVVSWNDAADNHDSVASDALVIPIRTGRPGGGPPPLGHHPAVPRLELAALGQATGQELGGARVDDRHPAQHLPDD